MIDDEGHVADAWTLNRARQTQAGLV
jgi:hypothetical protein